MGFSKALRRAIRPNLGDVNYICFVIVMALVGHHATELRWWLCFVFFLCGHLTAIEYGYRKRVKFERDANAMFDRMEQS